MAPSITRLVRNVVPGNERLGSCLVCHGVVRAGDDAVRLSGGGVVHHECATYRMRRRYGRPLRPVPAGGHDDFTGE